MNYFLLEIGLYRSDSDYCLYRYDYDKKNAILLLIYVDDIILRGKNEN